MTTQYGKSEFEDLAEKTLRCRQIVKEIVGFGVNQYQMLKIIELLAMELDNIDHMKKISILAHELNETKLVPDEDDENVRTEELK